MKIYLGWLLEFRGVAQYIDENNLSFENLKIVYNKYSDNGAVFELYELQENGEYEKISTLVVDTYSEDFDTKEYMEVKIEKMVELTKRISKEYSIEIAEAVEDKNGNYVVYDENGQVFVSTDFNEIERPNEAIVFESVNELKLNDLENRIAKRTANLKIIQEMQVPDSIIQREKDLLEKALIEKDRVLKSIKNSDKKSVTPSEIEQKTINGDVTVQSLQGTMKYLATKDKNLENEGEDLNVE